MNNPLRQDQPFQESSAQAVGDLSPHQAAELLAQRRSVQSPSPTDPAEGVQDPEFLTDDSPTAEETELDEEAGPLNESTEESDDEPESLDDVEDDQPEDADDDEGGPETYLIDGEEVTAEQLKEWRESGLRTADYQRKTQVLAEQRKAVESLGEELNTFAHAWTQEFQQQMQSLTSEVQQFAAVDWVKLANDDPKQYAAKRAAHDLAQRRYQETQQRFESFQQQYKQAQAAALQKRAQEAIPEIKSRVSGWNDALYAELRQFVSGDLGAPAEQVNRIVDPWFWELAADAHKYRKAKAIKTTVKPVKRSPSRTLKATVPTGQQAQSKVNTAMQQLKGATSTRTAMELAAEALKARRREARG